MTVVTSDRQYMCCVYCGKRSISPAHDPPYKWREKFGYNFCSDLCVYKYAQANLDELMSRSDTVVFSNPMLKSLVVTMKAD